jgi:predicted TPR repeat methyltransferase
MGNAFKGHLGTSIQTKSVQNMSAQEQAKALFLSGIEQIQQENYSSASQNFQESLKLAPGRPSTLDNLSVCLMKLGKFEEAEQACRASLAADEASPTPWFNLGLVQKSIEKNEEAIKSFQNSISIDPNFPDSWNYSGMLLGTLKRHPEAIACFERTLILAPDNVEAMCWLSTSFSELEFYFSALATIEKAVEIAPESALAFSTKGKLHQKLNQNEEAIGCLKRALELNPVDRDSIEYSLAAMTGQTAPARAPVDYVVGLFDDYADKFETHLEGTLHYQTPRVLFQHLDPVLKADSDIIDLGCGTGLMGALLRKKAKTLVGVDLSRKMLDKAGEKNIYDLLIFGDIEGVLSNREDSYDAVIAADVFVYLGELANTFLSVKARLRGNGLFAFSVESFDGDRFQLKPSRRYGHSANYIRELAKMNGFAILTFDRDLLRMEASEPDGKAFGYYVVLQKVE